MKQLYSIVNVGRCDITGKFGYYDEVLICKEMNNHAKRWFFQMVTHAPDRQNASGAPLRTPYYATVDELLKDLYEIFPSVKVEVLNCGVDWELEYALAAYHKGK